MTNKKTTKITKKTVSTKKSNSKNKLTNNKTNSTNNKSNSNNKANPLTIKPKNKVKTKASKVLKIKEMLNKRNKNSETTNTKTSPKTNANSINKNPSLKNKLLGLIELGRPIEWSKSFLNMMLAGLMVYYSYNIFPDPIIFLLGFFAVAFLWSGLYALNDVTDWKIDLLHATKKNRPIPSGKVSPKEGLFFSFVLIFSSFLISFLLGNFLLFLCLSAMLLNQLFYTMEPYRLKSRKGFDVISGSMINPFFRYLSGIVLFVSLFKLLNNPFPILPIIFVVGIQFSGYSLYRLFSKKHDQQVNMKSTVALVPEKRITNTAYIVMFASIASYLLLIINGFLFKNNALGFLPAQYSVAVFIVLLLVLLTPDIRYAVLNPKKANMTKSYRTLYLTNIFFIIANVIVFFFFR